MGLRSWLKGFFKRKSYYDVQEKYRRERIDPYGYRSTSYSQILETESKEKKPETNTSKRRKEPRASQIHIRATRPSICDHCHGKFGYLGSYDCRYCGGTFCSEDRVPEAHACGGKPHSIPKAGRHIYSGNNTTVIGK